MILFFQFFFLYIDKSKGELFGLENLLKLNDENEICKTRELFERHVRLERGVIGLQVSNFIETTTNDQSEEGEESTLNDPEEEKNERMQNKLSKVFS